MNCPNCGSLNKTRVYDKRNNGPLESVRRRRQCLDCGERFTTYELRSDQIDFSDQSEETEEEIDEDE